MSYIPSSPCTPCKKIRKGFLQRDTGNYHHGDALPLPQEFWEVIARLESVVFK